MVPGMSTHTPLPAPVLKPAAAGGGREPDPAAAAAFQARLWSALERARERKAG